MNDDEIVQLRELNKVWPKLSRHQRDIILLTAGLIKLPRDRHGSHRTPRGATPDWLAVALNILKDSTGQLSDREIAKRVGVSDSTLCRNATYRHAKHVFFQKTRRIVRVGRNVGKVSLDND